MIPFLFSYSCFAIVLLQHTAIMYPSNNILKKQPSTCTIAFFDESDSYKYDNNILIQVHITNRRASLQ